MIFLDNASFQVLKMISKDIWHHKCPGESLHVCSTAMISVHLPWIELSSFSKACFNLEACFLLKFLLILPNQSFFISKAIIYFYHSVQKNERDKQQSIQSMEEAITVPLCSVIWCSDTIQTVQMNPFCYEFLLC